MMSCHVEVCKWVVLFCMYQVFMFVFVENFVDPLEYGSVLAAWFVLYLPTI